jgi:hypothetical protein
MNKENKLLFSKEDATHPQEICSLDLKTKQIQQLTNSAPTAIETSRLSIAEPFKVKSFDNTPIEGSFISQRACRKTTSCGFGRSWWSIGQDVDRFNSMTQSLTQAGFVVFNKLSRFYWLWESISRFE